MVSDNWFEVDNPEYLREWEHEDGHRIQVEANPTRHLHPEERTEVNYEVRLTLNDGGEFTMSGLHEGSREAALEVSEELTLL